MKGEAAIGFQPGRIMKFFGYSASRLSKQEVWQCKKNGLKTICFFSNI
ncbi:hypothetical protein HOLDEFILI_00429 [Holdemania filiformis DSM 12042]|uniref:Uncharacterized protein n=1 Tax=Holdemania filiformis DSM 12042 TaxID=545696 RepID=B9Y3Q1_9FIRM|nr:hypothetical protein HOLDEFILI_00429 [Holdemania filiformis DSM 12042]